MGRRWWTSHSVKPPATSARAPVLAPYRVTDGRPDIRDLPRRLNPRAAHQLDWFHITMPITVLTWC